MAQKIEVQFIDDLDGGPAAGTVTFGLDGQGYEIDLSEANAAALREAITPWIEHARKASGGTQAAKLTGGRAKPTEDLNAIREWARENGYQISGRGRISSKVMVAYRARVAVPTA